ncbi:MAG: DNA mismatch repair protein MutS [Planctomycetia bacterium]|nr:DNA mismatch repair protein MutS [Planctomycetia bacterium]
MKNNNTQNFSVKKQKPTKENTSGKMDETEFNISEDINRTRNENLEKDLNQKPENHKSEDEEENGDPLKPVLPRDMTPMMRHYWEAKKLYPNAILLCRVGDFYELFHEDAKIGARILNLALTSRSRGADPIPMAGFPHHQLDAYIGKIISNGYCAAVFEQVEDPKLAKGVVKREVMRVVTPGTITEDTLLDPRESNYLAAVVEGEITGIAWVELSTGKFFASSFPSDRLVDQLARIHPTECLLCEGETSLPNWLTESMMLTHRPTWSFGRTVTEKELCSHFGVLNLEGFGFLENSLADQQAIRAAGAIIDYLKETQKGSLEHIDTLSKYTLGSSLEIDEASRRSLEIMCTLREGRKEGSLLAILDKTITSAGGRQLADWLANPLTDLDAILLRQQSVAELFDLPELCRQLRDIFRGIYDLQRHISRVSTGRASPRDLRAIGLTLTLLPEIKSKIQQCNSPLIQRIHSEIDPCNELSKCLQDALVEDPPLLVREGGIIRTGYHEELDSLRELVSGGRKWITEYLASEQNKTGIQNMKVGYTKVFGYYLDIPNSQKNKVPDYYFRKQTLKNSERYITEELKTYEENVLTAGEKAAELEFELFNLLRETVMSYRRRMQNTAQVLADLDVLVAFAELARQHNYCCPEIHEEPILEITEGRHPVLDIITPSGEFVPNDVSCNPQTHNILLITGPNMAGKSTYIRQVALLVLMAQIGSFIPAKTAKIGIVDRIFARVGASDELSRGQSTFMVEMTETARILNTATSQSLLILDEIGRGTSTYDGISLAWAILEHIHNKICSRTLFATHYHELTDLAKSLYHIKNLNVAVREWADDLVFLHKIVDGAADKSYGIHVARLAGVPSVVVERAKTILAELEVEHLDINGKPRIPVHQISENLQDTHNPQNTLNTQNQSVSAPSNLLKSENAKLSSKNETAQNSDGSVQLLLFEPQDHPFLDDLRETDLNQISPIQALQKLIEWQEILLKEKNGTLPKHKKK